MPAAWVANEFYAPIIPIVMELHGKGLSLRAIGRELDRRGIRTSVGHWCGPGKKQTIILWSAAQVRRVLARGLAAAESRPDQQLPACDATPPASQQVPPAAARIHLLIDQADKGPFTNNQVEAMLDAGEITPETLFRREGMERWQPLHTIIADQPADCNK